MLNKQVFVSPTLLPPFSPLESSGCPILEMCVDHLVCLALRQMNDSRPGCSVFPLLLLGWNPGPGAYWAALYPSPWVEGT